MFEQVVGNGANEFLVIIAVLIGFGAALGYTDFIKTNKENEKYKP